MCKMHQSRIILTENIKIILISIDNNIIDIMQYVMGHLR